MKETIEQRIARSVVPGPGGCLDWAGALSHGYGRLKWDRRPAGAHRLACEAAIGRALVAGEVVAHRCDRPVCCNPDHLFVTDLAGNNADMKAKGRVAKGESSGLAKLKARDVEAIRLAKSWGEHSQSIADRYGMAKSHINKLIARTSWK